VSGGLLVEATNRPDEIPWLLDAAREAGPGWGVIGAVPLDTPDAPEMIQVFARQHAFRGVRLNWLAPRPNWRVLAPALRALADAGLVLDILAAYDLLPEIAAFARAFPHNPIVVGHLGGVDFSAAARAGWPGQARALADAPNVAMKFSGWPTPDALAGYLDAADGLFGGGRLMHATNWPICGAYAAATEQHLAVTAGRSQAWRTAFFSGTAQRIYGLKVSEMR
jgi:L-fuconolactonase